MSKNKNIIWLLLTFTMLTIVGTVAYFSYQTFFHPTESSTTAPTKTSEEDGYIIPSVAPAVTGAEAVSDVGEAQWVKVTSDKKLERFTDLSKNGITIYRINNPEVLKTTTNISSPAVPIAEIIAKYPDALVMNASGFSLGTTGYPTGLQINNGQIIRDWASGSGSNQYAFTISKDGTCKIYDATTPASQMIEDGVQQDYSFLTNTAIIRDGVLLNNGGIVNWMIHSFIANDKENNLYAIISDTNAGYQNIIDTVADLNLENMMMLDGGGSSQMAVKGQIVYPSQDNRLVPDYIVMR